MTRHKVKQNLKTVQKSTTSAPAPAKREAAVKEPYSLDFGQRQTDSALYAGFNHSDFAR
jgi:hypothetical protein